MRALIVLALAGCASPAPEACAHPPVAVQRDECADDGEQCTTSYLVDGACIVEPAKQGSACTTCDGAFGGCVDGVCTAPYQACLTAADCGCAGARCADAVCVCE